VGAEGSHLNEIPFNFHAAHNTIPEYLEMIKKVNPNTIEEKFGNVYKKDNTLTENIQLLCTYLSEEHSPPISFKSLSGPVEVDVSFYEIKEPKPVPQR
jgi:hypothetical protein